MKVEFDNGLILVGDDLYEMIEERGRSIVHREPFDCSSCGERTMAGRCKNQGCDRYGRIVEANLSSQVSDKGSG